MRMLLALPLLCLPVIALQADDLSRARIVVLPAPPDYFRSHLSGRVIARGEETITIKPEGNPTTQESYSFYPDGYIKEKRIYLLDDPKEPKTFVFSNELHWHNRGGVGAPPPGGVSSHDGKHRIDDLRGGDLVWIRCNRTKGTDYCAEIHILRRPGGRVPPAIGDAKTKPEHRVDVRRNAEQFLEETLIPAYRDLKLFPAR